MTHGQGPVEPPTASSATPSVSPAASSPPSPAVSAPAPAPTGPKADILNIVEAKLATFVNDSTLVLAGLSRSVQWVVDDSTARQTGKIPVAKWLGADFQKNGSWLGSPAAVLHASLKGSGNDTANVVRLSAPIFNSSANSLYFTYTPLAAGAQLSLQAGAANSALASPSTTPPLINTLLQDVALFVDDALPVSNIGAETGGTKLGFEPLGGRRGGISNAAGTVDSSGGGRGGGLVNVGLGGCYFPGGFSNACSGYGYYGGAFG